jgi:hypothetical protein
MVDILVRPTELRQASGQLQTSAKRLTGAMQSIDKAILSLKGDHFLGNRADTVQARYAPQTVFYYLYLSRSSLKIWTLYFGSLWSLIY